MTLLFFQESGNWLPIMGMAFSMVLALLTFTVWLIRLEGMIKRNAETLVKLEKSRDEIDDALYKHFMDPQIHFNKEAMTEWRQSWEFKLSVMTNSLQEINRKIDRLSGKE